MSPLFVATSLALIALSGSCAVAADAATCLSAGETQERVSAGRVVGPAVAILTARRAVPQAEILRAALCETAAGPIYMLLAMRRDGRLVHVTVDAPSGTVATLR